MGNKIIHVEVVGKDGAKLQKFYSDVFGWSLDTNNPGGYGMLRQDELTAGFGAASDGGAGHVTFYVERRGPAGHPGQGRGGRRPGPHAADRSGAGDHDRPVRRSGGPRRRPDVGSNQATKPATSGRLLGVWLRRLGQRRVRSPGSGVQCPSRLPIDSACALATCPGPTSAAPRLTAGLRAARAATCLVRRWAATLAATRRAQADRLGADGSVRLEAGDHLGRGWVRRAAARCRAASAPRRRRPARWRRPARRRGRCGRCGGRSRWPPSAARS